MMVEVKVKGVLVEMTEAKTGLKEAEVKSMQKAVEQYLAGGMRKLVKRLQELKSDAVGFGELIRARQPGIWKRVRWREVYPRLPVDIRVQFNAERTGIYR